jgi:hypothetical protein
MSYPHPGPLKHNPSTYSTASTDPYNRSVQQLPYDSNAQYGGGYGQAPGGNGQDGQYAPYQDTARTMQERLDSGGQAKDTWATESGVSESKSADSPIGREMLIPQTSTLRLSTNIRDICSPDRPRRPLPRGAKRVTGQESHM